MTRSTRSPGVAARRCHARPAGPERLAEFRDVRCAASEATIRAALAGNYRAEHVFALRHALELYDFHQAKIAECDAEIERVLRTLNEARATPRVRVSAHRDQ